MKVSDLTPQQLQDITTIERVSSILSLLGCCWIAVTFLSSPAFQKPINRLVFYASIGNIFTNAATIMSRDFVSDPRGAGCQLQAFFIQMFMPADAVWTLAMATNVWLTFYHKYDCDQLRSLEKWYFLLCYGIPFVPALAFVFISGDVKGRVYGNATLWCWVSKDWEVLRIACFYGPVWLVILATVAIYLRAGRDIYAKRKQLQAFQDHTLESLPTIIDPFTNCKTTEIMVTSETVTTADVLEVHPTSDGLPRPNERRSSTPNGNHQGYQVTVSTVEPNGLRQEPQWPDTDKVYSPSYNHDARNTIGTRATRDFTISISPQVSKSHYAAAPLRRRAAMESNSAAWSYTKVAVLFFLAMMVTWIPSSANRVYSVMHPGSISLPLQFISAFVLPLQGLWNALIYTTTSLSACRQLWSDLVAATRTRGTSNGGGLKSITSPWSFGHDDRDNGRWSRRLTMRNGSQKLSLEESESMTELQSTRPSGKGS